MNEVEKLIEKLKKYYHVSTLSELGQKIEVPQTTISGWASRNSIKQISRKIYELNIPIKNDDDTLELENLIIENIRFNLASKIDSIFKYQKEHNLFWRPDILPKDIFLKILNIVRTDSSFGVDKSKTKEMLCHTIFDYNKTSTNAQNMSRIIMGNLSNLECYVLIKMPTAVIKEDLEVTPFFVLTN